MRKFAKFCEILQKMVKIGEDLVKKWGKKRRVFTAEKL